MGRYTGKKCRLLSMFGLTLSFFFVEIIVGYVTNSMALIADSFHMLSDIAALIIAFLSVRMAPKSWDKNTYGWARAEVLGALVNAVFLIALCFSISVESFKRFYEPEDIHNPDKILIVGALGLLVNLMGLCLFHEHGGGHGHSHGGHGHAHGAHSHLAALAQDGDVPKSVEDAQHRHANEPKIPSNAGGSGAQMNMRGVFLHVMADALGSVVVIISAVIMWKTEWEYKVYVDPGNLCTDPFWAVDSTRPILGSGYYTDPFWAIDSTYTHFGPWILHRPILGSGFYTDPFWAVDSTQIHFGQWTLHHSVKIFFMIFYHSNFTRNQF